MGRMGKRATHFVSGFTSRGNSLREKFARPGKVGWSIDTERYGVNEGDVDPHAGLQRTQLLQPFADLEGVGGNDTKRSRALRR